jgi:predicted naringenin-chalcone synthase
MSITIHGLATALPEQAIDQAAAAADAVQYCAEDQTHARRLHKLYQRSTVQKRHSVLLNAPPVTHNTPHDPAAGHDNGNGHPSHHRDNNGHAFFPKPIAPDDRGPTVAERMTAYRQHALPLVQQAADAALAEADVTADAISQLITVSCTGFSAPGLDVQLIDALDLRPDVGRTMVGFMGCHGALNGLRVARGLAEAPGGWVLLCAVELCSLHFQYGWTPDQVLANALFADGAAAVVLRSSKDNQTESREEPDGSPAPPRVVDTRSMLLPDSRADMQWHIAEHGFEMVLSKRVPSLIETHLRPWLVDWLDEHGLTVDAVGGWAIHPGGPQVIAAVERALHLPAGAGDVSRAVLAAYGNMSSPTVMFILDRLRAADTPRPWVALGFGPGLIAEAALIR